MHLLAAIFTVNVMVMLANLMCFKSHFALPITREQTGHVQVFVVSHSWGDTVFRCFMSLMSSQDPEWVDGHIAVYTNIAGPRAGASPSPSHPSCQVQPSPLSQLHNPQARNDTLWLEEGHSIWLCHEEESFHLASQYSNMLGFLIPSVTVLWP